MLDQAVILCGGHGERLRPLTDQIPKPLASVNGRPFLTLLLDQLKAQGIKHVLLLLGYRGHQIRQRYGSSYQRMSISYSVGMETDTQGERLWRAKPKLDERFLLLYGDTLVPDFDLPFALAAHGSKMISAPGFKGDEAQRVVSEPLITLGAVAKRPGNVSMDGGPARYFISPSPTILWTDVGYMIVEREAIADGRDLPVLLQTLGIGGRLAAYPVETQLCIDTPELLAETERALAST